MKSAIFSLVVAIATLNCASAQTPHLLEEVRYSAKFTTCIDVEQYRSTTTDAGEPAAPSSALFSPLPNRLRKRLKLGDAVLPEKIEQARLVISEIESPRHGGTVPDSGENVIRGKKQVHPVGTRLFYYEYQPEVGYLGKDRAIYAISAAGKTYKMTINFVVVPVVYDDQSECARQRL